MKIREQIEQELARREYAEYCKYVHRGQWILGKHLELICHKIEDLIYRRIKENILIISMPPQHGKSQCVTETLPSFYLGKYPSRRVIEVSYGDDLAQRFGRRNKEKIVEFGKDLFDIELSKTSDTDFELKGTKGSMISKGIMAGLTGNPGDLIIIDDPIKNRQEAESETYRNRIWEEFLNSIYTRLSAQGVIVLIMTRWHEDDLAGRLLKNMPEKCMEINIPLEAEENDILGRKPGDALFPEIGKDNEWLQSFKQVYTTQEGSRSWNALMQGRPSVQEGNMLKRTWWKYYVKLPDNLDFTMQSWDLSFKDTDNADKVAGQVWGAKDTNLYLIDMVKKRMSFTDTIRAIEHMTKKYPEAVGKLIEDKANGPAIISMLNTKIGGMIPIDPKGSKENNGGGSKIARVSAVSPLIEAGNVYLPCNGFNPDGTPILDMWVQEFIDICAAFPNGAEDDCVDAMSQFLRRFIYTILPQQQNGKKAEDEDDDEDTDKGGGYYD